MASPAVSSSTYSYAVFHYVIDKQKGTNVPVGVALWKTDTDDVSLRFLHENETVPRASSAKARKFIEVTERRIRKWLRDPALPYAPASLSPYSDAWWEHMADLLGFNVTMTRPRPIDCTHPSEELEELFEAIVDSKTKEARSERIDSRIRDALGDLADEFQARMKVPAYDGREVQVLRGHVSEAEIIVIDGVNLASPSNAEKDADALASRLQRVAENQRQLPVHFVVGYLSSPGGLNSEGVLKNWIEHKIGTRIYDLTRDQQNFYDRAEAHSPPKRPNQRQLAVT